MQRILTFLVCVIIVKGLSGQTYQEISTGQGYNKQSFVRLADDYQKQVNNDAWDIAFSAFGFQDAGIFINESSGSSMGQNLPQTELYYAETDNFNATIDVEAIKNNRYLNTEESWNYGAFNEIRDTMNPYDFGWGEYLPSQFKVVGDKVYVIRLRNGEYRKIKIESLTSTTYTFRYSKLDGTGEVVKTLDKMADSYGKKFIFYNLTTHATVDVLPEGGFDLMYCRYISIAKDPAGTIIQQYNVTGILSGFGVKTAEADGVNPVTVSFEQYKDSLKTLTDVIGYDWKTLVGTTWSLDMDRVYFVKTADGKVWKIRILDFEGSFTGTAVLEKTDITASATSDLPGVQSLIYPNPATDRLYIVIDKAVNNPQTISISVTDATGRKVYQNNTGTSTLFGAESIDTGSWTNGVYYVTLTDLQGNKTTTKILKN